MKLRSIFAAVIASAIVSTNMAQPYSTAADTAMRDMTTMEIVTDMGIGINLGNTFESCGDWIDQWGDGTPNAYETAWGSPTVTKELIQGYAEAGFGVVRIPVAWSNMMSRDGSYTIHPDYMARVKQVVDWALEADLYVILNLHWDGGWLEALPTDYENCMTKYKTIWTQICGAFSAYGDRLMFESQNEELGWSSVWNQWGGTTGKEESYGYVNAVNQAFVDVVRSAGGNHAQRHLLISGYNTDITLTCDPLFRMPADPAERCALSVHYYTPAGFALLTEDASWGKASSTWGTQAEYDELQYYINMLDARYASQGVPVIIGEYGCPKENKEEASVRRFLSAVCEAALAKQGICPVLWDITDLHYNRKTYEMTDPVLKEQLLALKEQYRPASSVTLTQGDINEDGKVSVADAIMLSRYLAEDTTVPITAAGLAVADLNNDGLTNMDDAVALLQSLAGLNR